MKLYFLVFILFLLFTACSWDEHFYENEYLKLTLPEGWIITDKNNQEDSYWLVSTLIPLQEKFFSDTSTEAPVQNFIIVAVNAEEMAAKYGHMDFDDYCKGLHERLKQPESQVGRLQKINFKGKETYYWKRLISREGKEALVQEKYLFQLPPFYTSFQLTHSVEGEIIGSAKILESVVFKK